MMSGLLIRGGTIVNEGESYRGWIVVEGERIARTGRGDYPRPEFDGETIDAEGMYVLPGVIDDQVHFREPGLTYKGDLHSESIAAAAGGVTSYMDMPNVKPPTVTNALLEEKLERAAETSVVNYSFYLGATNDNIEQIRRLDPKRVCGVKLFMGSSTGNMLVDDERALRALFAESPVPIAAHCEDEPTVRADMERFRTLYGESGLTVAMHPLIRSAEACLRSSEKAVSLAERYGGRLHVLHLSTARELSLFDRDKPLEQKRITCEVCVHHLWFSDADYARKGNLIKWNPAVKTAADRDALRAGLLDGAVDVVATDHAPHTLEEKERPYASAPSGGRRPRPGLPANGPFRRYRARPARRSMDRIERKHPVQVRLVAFGRYRVLAPHRADARQRTDRLCRRTGRYDAPGSGARVRPVKANAGVRQNRRGSAAGQKERDSRERAAVVRRSTQRCG